MPPQNLIIGAAGAVGKRLCNALARAGSDVIAADRMEFVPSTIRFVSKHCIGGVDVRDPDALDALFKEYADEQTIVWNLASPLSVETALRPQVAEAVTIGGMKNVLSSMSKVGCRRIMFTDSIGSFGGSAPKDDVEARWLVSNPDQDPGSDYGLQKRACRELLDAFAKDKGGDPRIALLPGVLHSEPVWGNGTTEYALDAMLAASRGEDYVCPIEQDVRLPMVYADDLMRGLLSLALAHEEELREPQRLYSIPGLSFTPDELFHEIRQHIDSFNVSNKINANMDKFAKLWPDTLSTSASFRDLDYEPDVTLPRMVASVLNAHSSRKLSSKAAFRSIDTCESGVINDYMLERYVRKYLVRGREKFGYMTRRQDMVMDIVAEAMAAMDVDKDGVVSQDDFLQWSRVYNVEGLVDDFSARVYTHSMNEA
jgi:threonine 3-dehydrogenase